MEFMQDSSGDLLEKGCSLWRIEDRSEKELMLGFFGGYWLVGSLAQECSG